MLTLIVAAALAATWHPSDIAGLSNQFNRLSARQADVFEARNRTAAALSVALRDYRTALDTLGARAPAAERERLLGLEEAYNVQFLTLQAYADGAVQDTEDVFLAALERATKAAGISEPPCEKSRPRGGRHLPGMPVHLEPNPDCVGEDANPGLAARIDADAVLTAFVDAALVVEWPALGLSDVEPVKPIGEGTRTISVIAVLRAVVAKALTAVDKADDLARSQAGLDLATLEEAAAMLDTAKAITARTAAARAALADPLLREVDKVFARWEKAGEPKTVWCANPVLLGGCTGEDDSSALLPRLLGDKKVAKLGE